MESGPRRVKISGQQEKKLGRGSDTDSPRSRYERGERETGKKCVPVMGQTGIRVEKKLILRRKKKERLLREEEDVWERGTKALNGRR